MQHIFLLIYCLYILLVYGFVKVEFIKINIKLSIIRMFMLFFYDIVFQVKSIFLSFIHSLSGSKS